MKTFSQKSAGGFFLMVVSIMLVAIIAMTGQAYAHDLYVEKNPTNANVINFGISNVPTWCSQWRAYAKCDSGGKGSNSSWQGPASNWYYLDKLSCASPTTAWKLDGMANQNCQVTYWVFKADGTWEYGSQETVVSDQIAPTGSITAPYNGQQFTNLTINIIAVGQDERSGMLWIRIYLIKYAPTSCPSGYSRDSSNNCYRDYSGNYVNDNVTVAVAGNYTLAIWVKDNAGNVAMEPGSRVNFTVSSSPVETCGNGVCGSGESCTNCPQDCGQCQPACGDHTCNGNETCTSCPADCGSCPIETCGNGYCASSETCSSCPADCGVCPPICGDHSCNGTETCSNCIADCGSCPPQEVCGDNNCSISETCDNCPADCGECANPGCDEEDGKYACSFRSLVGEADEVIYYLPDSGLYTDGTWWDYQRLFGIFAYTTKCHLGSDFNCKGGDQDEPIYAPANCVVWNYSDISYSNSWGKWLLLRCTANPDYPFITEQGEYIYQVDIFLAHLGEIKIYTDTGTITPSQIEKQVTKVKQSNQIATVGNANGYYGESYHLHVEYRLFESNTAGSGYVNITDLNNVITDYADPVEFTENNRTLNDNRSFKVSVAAFDRNDASSLYVELVGNNWQRQGKTDEDTYTSVGKYDIVWLTLEPAASATWHFRVPTSGKYGVYQILARDLASAKVTYEISYANNQVYTTKTVDQNVGANNKRLYLGTYDFQSAVDYQVQLSRTDNSDQSPLMADALELVYFPNAGIGGGSGSPDDLDDDKMPNDWEIANGLNPENASDAQGDPDNDGFNNLAEYYLGSDPNNSASPTQGVDPGSLTWTQGWNVEHYYDPEPHASLSVIEDSQRGQVLAITNLEIQIHWYEQFRLSCSLVINQLRHFGAWVKGSSNSYIAFEVRSSDNSQLQLWQRVPLDNSWQYFDFDYTPTETDSDAICAIHLGEVDNSILLDQVVEEVKTATPGDDDDSTPDPDPPADCGNPISLPDIGWPNTWQFACPFDAPPQPAVSTFNDSEKGTVIKIDGLESQLHWHQQLIQGHLVSTGQSYRITGCAKSSSSGTIQIEARTQDQLFLWQPFSVSNTWNCFDQLYTATQSNSDAHTYIHFGELNGTLYLASLTETQIPPPTGDDDDSASDDDDATTPPETDEDDIDVVIGDDDDTVTPPPSNQTGNTDNLDNEVHYPVDPYPAPTTVNIAPPQVIIKENRGGCSCSITSSSSSDLGNLFVMLLLALGLAVAKNRYRFV